MNIKLDKTYTIQLNEEEFNQLYFSVGKTSHTSRINAGMSPTESIFIKDFFELLVTMVPNSTD